MIIYEVNLTISHQIFNEYYQWLIKHIKIMLQFPGFEKAELCKEEVTEDDNYIRLSVSYTVNNRQNLEIYFEKYAVNMRNEGANKFGDSFKATRRIFSVIDTIVS